MQPQNALAEHELDQLADTLEKLLGDLKSNWVRFEPHLAHLSIGSRRSAENLLHYVTLRRSDIRPLQQELARYGLSSLGRAESHVLSSIVAVVNLLHMLLNRDGLEPDGPPPISFDEGRRLLKQRTDALLGPAPEGRDVRIMVTLPSEAADDYELVRQVIVGGMDCARINCAHDGLEEWGRMIANIRRARQEVGRHCQISMDIAGPKLRTGAMIDGPRVMKLRPKKDELGEVERAARVWLVPETEPPVTQYRDEPCLSVPAYFLTALKPGATLTFKDTRGRSRSLTIEQESDGNYLATSLKTAYIETGTKIKLAGTKMSTRVGTLPAIEEFITLKKGDVLILCRDPAPGRPAKLDDLENVIEPARISCTLPEIFQDVKPGERIWFDDGKIGGVILSVTSDEMRVEITTAKLVGEKLRADKGINLPDSELTLPSLTEKDIQDLAFIVKNADIVGYSFVKTGQDVRDLQNKLIELGDGELGVILKIETRRAFEQLPDILLSSMRSRAVGVMIARGDLAVESGFERMAEVQEEIMWLCEAAHMPVIWATQVLEQLSKKGVPSRAEITDAAMSERAECVMLNKGPYVVEAVRALDDILTRMQAHQEKKRSMLRSLKLADEFFLRHDGIENLPV